MTREDFSVEHKEPWLDSADPVGLFFDLENIAYSHQSCNYAAARRPNQIHANRSEAKAIQSRRYRASLPPQVRQARRRALYEKHGC